MAQNHFRVMEYIDIQFGTIKRTAYTLTHAHTVHNICYLKYYKASWCVFILHFNEDPSAVFASSRTLFLFRFSFWCITRREIWIKTTTTTTAQKKFTWKNNSIRLNFLRVSSWACNSAPHHFNFRRIFCVHREYMPRFFFSMPGSLFSHLSHLDSIGAFTSGAIRCVTLQQSPFPNWVAILSRNLY